MSLDTAQMSPPADGLVGSVEARPAVPSGPGLKPALQARLFRLLSVQFRAGITIEQAVAGLLNSPEMGFSLSFVYRHLQQGYSISASFRKAGFQEPVLLALLALGERTGRLDECLGSLADLLEWREALRSELRSRLVYPVILSIACVLLVCLLPVLLSGPLLAFLEQGQTPLPWITVAVMQFGEALGSWQLWTGLLTLAPLGVLVGTAWWRRQPEKRERLFLSVPGLGPFYRSVVSARFARALLSCHRAGYPLLSSLQLAGKAGGSPQLEMQGDQLCRDLIAGKNLEKRWSSLALLDPLMITGLTIGYSTGRLEDVLEGMLRLTDARIRSTLESMMAALEPLLLAAMGVGVGAVVLATALPLSSLLEGFL